MNNINKKDNIFFLKIKKVFLIFFLLCAFFQFTFLTAREITVPKKDILTGQVSYKSFGVDMSPEFPGENEEVKFSLDSYSVDIDSTKVTVYVDGFVYKQATGLKGFSIKTGNYGELQNVRIVLRSINNDILEKEFLISPAEVDLVYQLEDAFIPEEYKGKATVLSNSKLKVFAFPTLLNDESKNLNKENLVYTWYKDFKIDKTNSGYGKYSYKVEKLPAYPIKTRISVVVKSLDGKFKAENHIDFRPKYTEAEFYLKETSMPFSFKNIVGEKIISNLNYTDIVAIPFFMNDLDGKYTKYTWKVNDRIFKHKEKADKNEITFTNDLDNFVENISVSLEIVNRERILQSLREVNFYLGFEAKKEDEVKFFTQNEFTTSEDEDDGFFSVF